MDQVFIANPKSDEFPAILKAARKARKITAIAVANAVGMSRGGYDLWELPRTNPKASIPMQRNLQKALDFFKAHDAGKNKVEPVDTSVEIQALMKRLKELSGAKEIHLIG